MTTVNYPSPVMVNGYSCRNCTEVDEAKKHVDPAHPQDGPFGVNAKTQPPSPNDPHQKADHGAAVTFGGVLAGLQQSSGLASQGHATQGLRLDISA